MNYKISTRDNPFGGVYVRLDIDDKLEVETYHLCAFTALWHAFWLDRKVKSGRYIQSGDALYSGKIKQ